MFKRISYLLLLMLYTFLGYSQGLLRYEYWIDSDFSKRTIVNHSAEDISFNVPYEKMSQGAHFLNFRAQGVNGEWGTFCRYLFLVPEPSTSSTAAIGYEYWFDNNTQQRTFGNTNNGLVSIAPDISQLEEGAHFFNIRIINNEGTWSNVYRYLFIRNESMSKSANSDLCEYWFDDNYTKRQNVVVSNGQLQTLIDISPLDDGNVHYLNVRVKNTENVWGSITRYLVFMPNDVLSTNSPLVGYQYGFNGQMTYVPISERQSFAIENLVVPIPDLLQAGTIDSGCKFTFNQPEGKVTMNREGSITFTLLFKNKTGRWTSPYCEDIKQTDQQIRDLLPMSVGKPIKTQKVDNGDFIAFEMQITDPRDYYIHASQTCRIDIYESNGSLLTTLDNEELKESAVRINLVSGTYYGIVSHISKNEANPDDELNIRIMTTQNYVPTPQIAYEDERVSIVCDMEDAHIVYSIDGSEPSINYTGAFELKHNAVIKAKATYPDYDDSEVAVFTVDSYKVQPPNIEFTNLQLYMTCPTEGANIFFTTDGTDPTANGQRYTGPVPVSGNCTVKAIAKREGYNHSDIVTFVVDISNVKTSTPTITRQDNTLLVSSRTEGAVFYYTTDGTTPNANSPHTDQIITLDYNCVVTVIAMKEGEIASDKVTFTVDWLRVDTPVLSFNDGQLTISCSTPGATIYYVIGEGTPSIVYTSPIVLTDNRTVTAMAKANDLLDSETATYNPNSFTCEPVTFSFNGHELLLSCATEGAVILFTTDGTQPGSDSQQFSGKLTINEILTVKALAMRANTNSSALTTYTIPAYYDGMQAEVGTPGQLSQAFGWCKTEDIEQLVVKGTLNEADLATLRNMSQLEHLDMSGVKMTDSRLPDKSFKDMALVSIIIPESLTGAGTNLFDGCQQLAAIKWQTNFKLTEQMLQGVDNPNLLVYVKLQSDAPTSVGNVVVNGYANSITLTDRTEGNSNFYCPESFTTGHISYQHNYQQQTVVGECRGWETLALPFDVASISHKSQGQLAPFAKDEADSKPFWLCRLEKGGFERADRIEANTPYIISMPNNQSYADQYILGGQVTFEARNVQVYASSKLVTAEKGEFTFVPCFTKKVKTPNVLPLNVEQSFYGYPEGSNFFRDLNREVRPFEAYILSAGSASRFAIGEEATGIYEIPILSEAKVRIYNLSGQLVYAGQNMDKVHLKAGIYIVNGKRMAIK